MSKIKVLYLLRRTVGGMQTHVVDLVSRLDKDRFEVKVAAPFSEQLQGKLDALGVPLIVVDIPDRLSLLKDFKSILRIRKILKKEKPDIFHIHGNKSALVGRFAAKFLRLRSAIVVTVHNFLIYQKAGFFKRSLAFFVERYLSKSTAKIIAVSERLKKNLVEIEGISSSKIVTIPNGIDISGWTQEFDFKSVRKELGISSSDVLIGTAGRFVAWKGHKFLIEAFAKLIEEFPYIKLAIIGDGPLREELKKEVRKLKLEGAVKFLGFVDDIHPYFKTFDIFVLPSINEPFGIVLLEAMAAKCPIVATNSGGVPEIIEAEKTGILVKPADSNALAEGIRRLLLDEGLRTRLVENAYRVVTEKFSLDNMVQKTVRVYEECLEGGKKNSL